jgi:hypothetical protein
MDVTVDGQLLDHTQCAATCRKAEAVLRGGEAVEVTVTGPGGGAASLRVPDLSAPSGDELLELMGRRMSVLSSYQLDETLSSGRARVRTRYRFRAPDSFSSRTIQQQGGSELIWIGDVRYMRELPDGAWRDEGTSRPRVPAYIWESFAPFVDARVIGEGRIDGVPTEIVAFFGGDAQLPAWFRLWIDEQGIVRKAEMRAQGHFMDHRYFSFDADLEIRAPQEVMGHIDVDG